MDVTRKKGATRPSQGKEEGAGGAPTSSHNKVAEVATTTSLKIKEAFTMKRNVIRHTLSKSPPRSFQETAGDVFGSSDEDDPDPNDGSRPSHKLTQEVKAHVTATSNKIKEAFVTVKRTRNIHNSRSPPRSRNTSKSPPLSPRRNATKSPPSSPQKLSDKYEKEKNDDDDSSSDSEDDDDDDSDHTPTKKKAKKSKKKKKKKHRHHHRRHHHNSHSHSKHQQHKHHRENLKKLGEISFRCEFLLEKLNEKYDDHDDDNSSSTINTNTDDDGTVDTAAKDIISDDEDDDDDWEFLLDLSKQHVAMEMFLVEAVKYVWELGDAIQNRIRSKVQSSLKKQRDKKVSQAIVPMIQIPKELSIYSSDIIEVYTTAHEKHLKTGNEASSILKCSKMDTIVSQEICAWAIQVATQAFQASHDIVHLVVIPQKIEGDMITAVNETCQKLTSKTKVFRVAQGIVVDGETSLKKDVRERSFQNIIAAAVLGVCLNELLEQTGGKTGIRLHKFTLQQLLDVIVWTKSGLDAIAKLYPNIIIATTTLSAHDVNPLDASIRTINNNQEDERKNPILTFPQEKQLDQDIVFSSLVWANKYLSKIFDLARDEFLVRNTNQVAVWLDNAYGTDNLETRQTSDGRIDTALCENVYTLINNEMDILKEKLGGGSNQQVLYLAMNSMLRALLEKQIAHRDQYLTTFETCVAAANDFIACSDKAEQIFGSILFESDKYNGVNDHDGDETTAAIKASLEQSLDRLLSQYGSDAQFAVECFCMFVFQPIDEAISDKLFREAWLTMETDNRLAVILIKTVDDFMSDLKLYLGDFLISKALKEFVDCTVILYTTNLVRRSASYQSAGKPYWSNTRQALDRIEGDISVMETYYEKLSIKYPSIKGYLKSKFEILHSILFLLGVASGHITDASEIKGRMRVKRHLLILQKNIKNTTLLRFLIGDLWHLINPKSEQKAYSEFEAMEEDILKIEPARDISGDYPGLRLDIALAKLFQETKTSRSRPGIPLKLAERGEVVLNRFAIVWKVRMPADIVKPDT